MTRKAVVTGAAGFIGSSLTDRLLAEGWQVTGIDSFEDYYDRAVKERNLAGAAASPAFELVDANLLDLARTGDGRALERTVEGAEVVFHLAAQAGVRASWGEHFAIYSDNNVLATQVLLETCRRLDGPRVVYASSSSVYGDTDRLPMTEDAVCRPFSPYGVTKLAAEHMCGLYTRNFGLPTVSLRLFSVYGPRQRPDMAFHIFSRKMLAGEPFDVFGDGGQTRDFTFVGDIVDGLLAALDAPAGGVYNLGGGSRVTLAEAIAVLAGVAGISPKTHDVAAIAGDVRDTWADLSRSRADLGYEPKVTLADGLTAELEWVRELVVEGL